MEVQEKMNGNFSCVTVPSKVCSQELFSQRSKFKSFTQQKRGLEDVHAEGINIKPEDLFLPYVIPTRQYQPVKRH
jgi:hypothetical protein